MTPTAAHVARSQDIQGVSYQEITGRPLKEKKQVVLPGI